MQVEDVKVHDGLKGNHPSIETQMKIKSTKMFGVAPKIATQPPQTSILKLNIDNCIAYICFFSMSILYWFI